MLSNSVKIFFVLMLVVRICAIAQMPVRINVNHIVAAKDSLLKRFPVEKVYVHTDKNQYLIGDTIWLKVYVLDATYFLGAGKSKMLFVELIDDNADVVRKVMVLIKNGIGNAQIALTKEIFHDGGYALKAYTNWMQNFGPDYAFSKRFNLSKVSENSWLVKSDLKLVSAEAKDQVKGDLFLQDMNRMPVGLRNVEFSIMAKGRTLYREQLQSSLEGKLTVSLPLKEKTDGGNMHVEVRDLRKDGFKERLQIPVFVNRVNKIDLQFLPEGGNLVTGVQSLLGFKAINENGKGVEVSGTIYDSKNKAVTTFSSFHKGMGTVEFMPLPKERYIAQLNKPEGVQTVYKLPEANSSGIVVHIDNPEEADSLKVSLNATNDVFGTGGEMFLIGSARGIICYALRFTLRGPKTVSVAKRLFPTGIARFTILKGRKPLNERITFIDRQDQLRITLSANKPIYTSRDSVSLNIEVKDRNGKPVPGTFSLAITDDGLVKPDSAGNFSIETSLLLNSDLKGEVEEAGFYMQRIDKSAWKALDNLLVTQGWIGFDWKDVFSPLKTPAFDTVQLNNTNGWVKHMIFPESRHTQLNPWFLNTEVRHLNYAKSVISRLNYKAALSGNMLNEVKINSKKRDYSGFNKNGRGHANIVLDSAAIALSETTGLYELLRQKVPGIEIKYEVIGVDQGYGLRINNRSLRYRTNDSDIWYFLGKTPQDLKDKVNRIHYTKAMELAEIMYTDNYTTKYFPPEPMKPYVPGRKAMLAAAAGRAGLAVPRPDDGDKAIVQITWSKHLVPGPHSLGIVLPQKFYRPKYTTGQQSPQKDLRSTVHWEPNIVTDVTGKAKVSFYTTDQPGIYTLTLQGCDLQGSFGSFVSTIKVTSSR